MLKYILIILIMFQISFMPSAQAGWLSSWFTTSPENQGTATPAPSSVLGTIQPASPPAHYGGPRVLTVSPKVGTGATEITARDLEMQRNVIADRMTTNANMMEMILKNRAVAEAAVRDAQKLSQPTSPTPPVRPMVRAVMPAVPPSGTGDVMIHTGSSVIMPILPSGLKPVTPQGEKNSWVLPTVPVGNSGIQPILPNVAKPTPAVKKDNKP